VEKPVRLKIRAKAKELTRREGVDWSLPVGPREHMVRDYAPLSQRKLDVRIPFRSTTDDDWTVHLPPGIRVLRGTQAQSTSSPFGSVKVDVEEKPGAVRVHTAVRIDVSRVKVSDYPAFRDWCLAADRALGQRVVLGRAPVER
jgi:hypothetical protein